MEKDFSARIVDLEEAYEMAYKVANQITNDGFKIDIIIGIARGGLPPARFICDFLNITKLTTLQITHYTGGGTAKENVEVIDPLNIDLKGRNVLLVDDVNDSGETLIEATQHINTMGPGELKTAVLHEKSNTSMKADYTGSTLEEWEWLIYQWAVTEDILELLHEVNKLQLPAEKSAKFLSETYQLDVDQHLIEKALSMKENYFSNK